MKVIEEFKAFALKGNVIDLAVGVIIGASFGKIVSSLVKDIIMPPIGYITGGVDISDKLIVLKEAVEASEGVEEVVAITLNYGAFFNNIIDFLIIAVSIFVAIRWMNKLTKKEEKKAKPKPKKESEEVLLLREIRDELKKK